MSMTTQKSILPAIVIVIATLAIYWTMTGHNFIHYDDYDYVVWNPHVSTGLTIENLYWAFTDTYKSNWHPLTWISHMLDVELFGFNAGGHYAVNLIIHIANALLLFVFLVQATGKVWQAALVALIFAVHPVNVESVAWIAERKNVLSTFFFMLVLIAYHNYVNRKTGSAWLWVVFFLSLGLMSKPMLVTVPFLLLLLDIWPYQRLTVVGSEFFQKFYSLTREKLLLFFLVVASSAITYLVQESGGSVNTTEMISMLERVENALVSYVRYIGNFFYPVDLVILYPHPKSWALWKVMASLGGLIVISILVVFQIRRRPYLFVGWSWFLGTMVPVIGIVQVGVQSMADRYAYIPFIGLGIILVFGGAELLKHWRVKMQFMVLSGVLFAVYLMVMTHHYLGYWKYDVKLFSRVLEIYDPAYEEVLRTKGKVHIPREINSGLAVMYTNLGAAYFNLKLYDESQLHLFEAIRMIPDQYLSYRTLGEIALQKKEYKIAYALFYKAKQLDLENIYQYDYDKRLKKISEYLKVQTREQ